MALRKFNAVVMPRMLRNLATSIILAEKVRTTEAKAKQLRSITEKMITWARTLFMPAQVLSVSLMKRL